MMGLRANTAENKQEEFPSFTDTIYNLTSSVKTNLYQGWVGFSQSLNFSTISSALLAKENTQRVMLYALYSNLIAYMGTVILYEYGAKSVMHQIPEMENSWMEWGLDRMAHLYFLRLSMDTFVSNALMYANLNKALDEEHPAGVSYRPCPEGVKDPTAIAAANLMSVPYHYGNLAMTSAVRIVPVVGRFLELPLKTLVYGQSLVEYKLASARLCSQHRYQLMAENNAFAFGFGLSLLSSVALSGAMIDHYTGVNNPYVQDALFNFMYMYHILAAYLIEKPLPGQKGKGIDFFDYPREATDRVLKDGVEKLTPMLSEKRQSDYLQKLKRALKIPAVKFAENLVLPLSLRSFEEFMQRPDAKLFEELHRKAFGDTVNAVKADRSSNSVKLYKYLGPVLPYSVVSPETRKLLNIVLDSEIKAWLEWATEILNEAHHYAVREPTDVQFGRPQVRDVGPANNLADDAVERVAEQEPEIQVSTGNLGVRRRINGSKAGSTARLAASVSNMKAALFASDGNSLSSTELDQKSREALGVLYGAP